jgi:predicted dehydrogenase
MTQPRTSYALIGTGSRARMFYGAICDTFRDRCALVAICDTNQTRMDYTNRVLTDAFKTAPAPSFAASDFDRMLQETRPDCVIVTTVDRHHHDYIIRALDAGCDVITEKPMTIDAGKCQAILDAVARSGKSVRVTFNYRYAPHNAAVKELISAGAIGDVTALHFEWLLDTKHGADYFRRWHRDKLNSGGLMVHKSTHHFDLVNFWLGTEPQEVFAMGDLKFYGRENAQARGVDAPYARTTGVPEAQGDPFAIDLRDSPVLEELFWKAEHEDGYLRDQNVFSDGITIEDTMSVMVRYANRAVMTYALHAYAPWEGFNVSINGTGGRIELMVRETSYINAGQGAEQEGAAEGVTLYHFPLHGTPQVVPVVHAEGGHGGGDDIMLAEIFGGQAPKDAAYSASHVDGARSILTGIAANQSFESGQPVRVGTLLAPGSLS